MKSTIISAVLIFVLLAGCIRCVSNPIVSTNVKATVNYSVSNDIFPNPERGFYKYTLSDMGSGNALSPSTLKNYRKTNISLILREYYLKYFKDAPLSDQALANFDSDMSVIRRSGIKCVLRFAYSENETEPDAPLTIITQHLDQLKPHLEKNQDVITVLQAGFIGAWGEGYYSSNGLNSSGARYVVYDKILKSLPSKRMMEVRTPAYKKEFFQRSTTLTQDEAFNTENVARMGFHNDCFLASTTDYGTYTDATADKAYLNKECLYVSIGGETCPPDGISPADATKAQNDMRYLRWSYLNQDYYHGVNDQWITQGGMDNILREMGYRFQLISGEYTDKVAPGNTFNARIILKNLGYASLYNPRLVELILKNDQTKEVFKVKLDVEPRLWKPLVENAIDAEIGIPKDMPNGSYDLYLNLPDTEQTLYLNPDFSIQLANTAVWDAPTGYNNLGIKIQVAPENKTTVYSGNLTFKK